LADEVKDDVENWAEQQTAETVLQTAYCKEFH